MARAVLGAELPPLEQRGVDPLEHRRVDRRRPQRLAAAEHAHLVRPARQPVTRGAGEHGIGALQERVERLQHRRRQQRPQVRLDQLEGQRRGRIEVRDVDRTHRALAAPALRRSAVARQEETVLELVQVALHGALANVVAEPLQGRSTSVRAVILRGAIGMWSSMRISRCSVSDMASPCVLTIRFGRARRPQRHLRHRLRYDDAGHDLRQYMSAADGRTLAACLQVR